VPEARKPEATRPPEEKPTPKEEAKPAAAESKKAVARDVVVLTGSPLGGVRFEHTLHAARAAANCAACHHASRKEKPATAPQQACSDCHTKAAAPPMKTKYQAAFHNPTAQSGICIDCHKAESAKAKNAPLKCVECHKKENK
jgi:sRNA-binding protein